MLKQEWLDALADGLAKNHPPLPRLDPELVRLPFYGNALNEITHGVSPEDAADIVIKGSGPEDDEAKAFVLSVLNNFRARYGITDRDVEAYNDAEYAEKGPLNWPWVQAILRTLDAVPQLSAGTIALATSDVYQYLTKSNVQRKIDNGVRDALTPGEETVVVGHSLGSVVAYALLLREGKPAFEGGDPKYNVPLLVTVGSPLAVTAIRELAPGLGKVGGNRTPACVAAWFNAFDPRDSVALYPLDPEHFRLNPEKPAIENWPNVDNFTENRHGIKGYLGDPVVARRIYAALHSV
ncbi:MAG: hypothetical protein WB777_13195 [Mycobacterium sp.]